MTAITDLVISPLGPDHRRSGFCCGVDALDRYLQKQAKQDIRRRVSRVFVATRQEAPQTVIGYYTLSSVSIDLGQLPSGLARKLPKHPIPGALIGRLAVDREAKGRGVGSMLLADAIKRTLSVSDQIAIYAMVVDAIDEGAASFYEQFGFTRLAGRRPRLFLPIRSLQSE